MTIIPSVILIVIASPHEVWTLEPRQRLSEILHKSNGKNMRVAATMKLRRDDIRENQRDDEVKEA